MRADAEMPESWRFDGCTVPFTVSWIMPGYLPLTGERAGLDYDKAEGVLSDLRRTFTRDKNATYLSAQVLDARGVCMWKETHRRVSNIEAVKPSRRRTT